MVAIRLRRAGSKKRPFFRVVVTDSRAARDSCFVEILGHYNPAHQAGRRGRDKERVDYWIKQGRAAVRLGAHADRAPPDAEAGSRPAAAAGGRRSERRRRSRPACATSSRCSRRR